MHCGGDVAEVDASVGFGWKRTFGQSTEWVETGSPKRVHSSRSRNGYLLSRTGEVSRMLNDFSAPTSCATKRAQRRKCARETMVLRVGIIEDGQRNSFCLLRNDEITRTR